MAEYFAQTAFSAGEIAPNIYGQVSLSKYHVAATTARNVFVNYRGGLYSRAGTLMCPILYTDVPLSECDALPCGHWVSNAAWEGLPSLWEQDLRTFETRRRPFLLYS